MTIERRDFLKAATGAVAFGGSLGIQACAGLRTGKKAARKPNIIYIIVDDMGYADLGCYGGKQIQTPNIDRMAAEGIRFTDAYSGCTVCAPARSCLMTGFHMGHTSVRSNAGGVPLLASDVTVAERLKAAGYVCGGFGKWGLGDVRTDGVPEKHGFDIFFGYYHQIHAHNYYPDYLWANSEKVPLPGNADGGKKQYSHYLIFEEAKRFIRDNKDRPFFCYCPWTPPHGNYQIPEDEPAWQLYKDKPWPQNAKVVAAMDSMLDRQVGELIALLKELDLDDDTIIFFCSDNGAAQRFDGVLDSSGPLRGFKRDMHEGGIRVPMIARWPGKIEAGQESNLQWYFPDVMPTLCELAGVEPTPGIDGISVVPSLIGESAAGHAQEQHEYLYWEWPRYNWSKNEFTPGGVMQAVRMGDWKAVRMKGGAPLELYDLSKDVGEKNNIAAQHPDIVAKMERILKQARTEPRPQPEPEMPKGKKFR